MRKIQAILFFFFIYLPSQSQNLSYTCARDTTLGCAVNCFDLVVQFPDFQELGDDYTLKNISSNAACLPYVPPGAPGPSAQLIIDDRYSAVIPLPFAFPFYGTSYNSLIISTNGFVSFDISESGQFSHYDDLGDLPNASYDRALIMGPYHDLDPEENTSPTQQIKYQTFGTAPNRKWILSFYKVPLFVSGPCTGLIENTHQIVLHETTGIIEVDILDKQICNSWNGGKAMIGLQDFTRTKGIMAPNRRMSDPPWGSIGMNEAWRFYPTGGATLFRQVELLDGSGATLAIGDTTRIDANTFTWTFPNVCPPGNTTATYVVKTTYRHLTNPALTSYSLDTIRVLRNAMPVTSAVVNTTCGASVGSVTVTATGGTPPLTYTLNPGAVTNTTGIFTGLGAGNYTVTVTDASGTCTNTITASVIAVSTLSATYTSTNAACPGVSNGSITVVPTSGTAPFTFSANGGASQTTGVFTNLDPGTYNISFTDALGCNGSVIVTIDPGTPITASSSSIGASCPGANDGSITITPTSGIAPYTYSLNAGVPQALNVFTGLGPGTYVITVRDSRGCTANVTVTVVAGSGLSGSIFQTPATCPGINDGTVTLNPTSGVAPYTYSINGGTTYQASNTFTGLAAGLYTVTFRDANNCTGTRSINVGGGTPPATTATSANTSCAGASDGVIVINPIPGATYTINPGAISNTTGTFTGLGSGTYTISIATAGGCAGTVTPATVTIAAGAALSTTATSAAASCAGINNGAITVTPIGTGTTTYTLNPGAVSNTTGIFNGLGTGTYTIAFVTAAGCTGTVSPNPVVTANAAPTSTAAVVAASCPGASNGTITVNPVGAGTTYTLNPGAVTNTTGIFTGLGAGTYIVTFTTAAGCSGTVPVNPVVTSGPAPVSTATTAATSCPGVSDGSITVAPVGAGTTYTLNPGAVTNTTGIFTGMGAGTYTITFLTTLGCTGTVPVNPVVSSGPPVAGTATVVNTSCPTVNNGTITVTAPLGAGNTYTLNPGGVTNTTGIFTGLAPNTYTISFVTAAGCTGAISPDPVVAAGPPLTSAIAQVNPVCANINDGTITITPQAGTAAPYTATLTGPGGPYTYTGNGPILFSNLAPGNYNYNYAEAGGCTGTGGPVTLVTNAPIFTPATLTNLSCNNSANGVITFSPTGGVAPYQYSANAGTTYQASNTFNGLAAGPHTFRIRDNAGCIKDTTIVLSQPTVLTSAISGTTPAGCSNNDGTISATATGGTAPYNYAITGATVNTSGTSTGVFSNLANGPYTITITDAQGCTTSSTGTVGLTDNMFLTLGPDVTICAESTVTFDPQTNTETNIFTWTAINGTPAGTLANPAIKNAVASPLDTATYVLHAQWGGCERRDTIIVNVLRKPVANAGSDTAICNLTYAILRGSSTNLSGGVNYAWTPAADVEFPDQAVTRVYPPGNNRSYTYTLTVTDNYGCNFSVTDQVEVQVQPPVPAFAGNDTTAVRGVPHQLQASGGNDYLWAPSAPLNNAATRNPLATLTGDQKFVVRVTDVAGCIGYDTVFVKVYAGPAYYIPNAFTPNGDGLNDVFRPVPAGIARTEYFRIFNRYGETIFETSQYMKGWDGSFKGKKQPVGAYVWIIKGIDRTGKPVELKGTVMLLQ